MKRTVLTVGFAVLAVALVTVAAVQAQDMPEMPPPQEEHEWLQRFVGAWTVSAEAVMAPGTEPITCEGVADVKSLGGRWVMFEQDNEVMGTKMSAVLTLGYDTAKEQVVGTWIDSVSDHLWTYKGSLDKEKQALTLHSRGPNMQSPGEMADYREVLTFKNNDHFVMTSAVKGADGEWFEFGTVNYRRAN